MKYKTDNSLKFFINNLNEHGVELMKDDFIRYYHEQNDGCLFQNEEKEYVSFIATNGTENYESVVYFSDFLEKRLFEELNNAKAIIDDEIIQLRIREKGIDNYLDWILKELIIIQENSSELFELYPICQKPITGLIEYLCRKQKTNQINVEETINPNKDIVDSIFGFLKGKNDSGIKIMSDSEHERLIAAIKEMIEQEKMPEGINPFQKLEISNVSLRYCFYILHKKLYGIKPQRKYFIDFMKNYFIQFKDTEWDVLKSKFSAPPQTIDKFLPPIIKSQLQ